MNHATRTAEHSACENVVVEGGGRGKYNRIEVLVLSWQIASVPIILFGIKNDRYGIDSYGIEKFETIIDALLVNENVDQATLICHINRNRMMCGDWVMSNYMTHTKSFNMPWHS